jgi:uncharacterized protein YbjT (DUF2867 family)
MRIAVVGATGTLGPHAVRLLIDRGHDVVGVTTTEAKRPALEAFGAEHCHRRRLYLVSEGK